MPTYIFTCKECKTFLERTCSISENKEKGSPVCPGCGNEMKRKFTPVGIIWKTGGAVGKILDRDMNETEAEDALFKQIYETEE